MFEARLDAELQRWRAERMARTGVGHGQLTGRRTVRVRGLETVVITRRSRRSSEGASGEGPGQ